MRKLMITCLLSGAAVLAVPAIAAPQATTAPAGSSTTSQAPAGAAASTPATSPTANSPAAATADTPAAAAATTTTASASGGVSVGATVKDTQGGTVGKIESVDGQYAVLATTKNKVRLPISSFGKGADGPVLAMTQAQVDAAAASAAAKTAKP